MDNKIEWPQYWAEEPTRELVPRRYDAVVGKWSDVGIGEEGTHTSTIRLVTFNTWFQKFQRGLRHSALLDILYECDADVILLQEVNMQLLEEIHSANWVRDQYRYVRAGFRLDSIPSHGVMLLSRWPISAATLYPMPTHMGRKLLTAEVRINDEVFSFATAHLESMDNSDVRAEQLMMISETLNMAQCVVLAGDFNFCASWQEENDRLDSDYLDLWANVRLDEPGFTQDTKVNEMLHQAKGRHKQVRFDRILLRQPTGNSWIPRSIQLLGTEPVSTRGKKVFPSDHFGLFAELCCTHNKPMQPTQ